MRFLSTFFADPCANCSKFVFRIAYIVCRIADRRERKIQNGEDRWLFQLIIAVDIVGQYILNEIGVRREE